MVRYTVRYTSPYGTRRQKSFPTAKEAADYVRYLTDFPGYRNVRWYPTENGRIC